MPIEIAKQALWHASLEAMVVYVTAESNRRSQVVESFWKS